MKYKVTYRLYSHNYSEIPEEQEIITEEPFLFIERLRADLAMCNSDLQLGSYVIQPIHHLRVIK